MSEKSAVLVEVRELGVRLRHERHRVRSLREYVVRRVGRRGVEVSWFDALAGITFEVRAGELFAVVGPNGAGKTTLLRVLAGIVPPACGRVVIGGTVAPLIELGAGFDPELTGGENALLYGSLLGMPRAKMRARMSSVLEFAGLADAADLPVKSYSAGMSARLGFAVATVSKPDLLLVDEVLAVGDEAFRRRCFARIAELRAGGTAVVLVSHDLGLIESQAERGLFLEAGRTAASGTASEVVAAYRRRMAA